jgi:hypothetical protein
MFHAALPVITVPTAADIQANYARLQPPAMSRFGAPPVLRHHTAAAVTTRHHLRAGSHAISNSRAASATGVVYRLVHPLMKTSNNSHRLVLTQGVDGSRTVEIVTGTGDLDAAALLAAGHLVVKTSVIPNIGNGLFAGSALSAGYMLGVYSGELITSAESAQRNSPYVWTVDRSTDLHVDGGSVATADSPLRMVNGVRTLAEHARINTAAQATSEFSADGAPVIVYFTTRNVARGEELFMDYGDDYWANW